MKTFKLNCGVVIAVYLAASIARAGSLELRNGSLIKGKESTRDFNCSS